MEHAPALRTGGYLVHFWGAGFDVAELMGIVPNFVSVATSSPRQDRQSGWPQVAWFNTRGIIESNDRYLTIARSDLSAVIYDALGGGGRT